MLNILNNNIIEYVLNGYLNYEEDIIKLKKLYESLQYKFNIKAHLIKIPLQLITNFRTIIIDDSLVYRYEYWPYKNAKDRKIKHLNKYKNSQQYGRQKEWYKNGILKSIYYKSNDHQGGTGICKQYFNNGNIHTEIELKDGFPNGMCKIYKLNGEIKFEHDLKNCPYGFIMQYWKKQVNCAIKNMNINTFNFYSSEWEAYVRKSKIF
jgi:antitoxin component YwqK of YwqJK toxin-antitoxin module